MKIAAAIMGFLGFLTAFKAARYWYAASQVPIEPPLQIITDPRDIALDRLMSMARASTVASELNTTAAMYTGISVVLANISALLGIFLTDWIGLIVLLLAIPFVLGVMVLLWSRSPLLLMTAVRHGFSLLKIYDRIGTLLSLRKKSN